MQLLCVLIIQSKPVTGSNSIAEASPFPGGIFVATWPCLSVAVSGSPGGFSVAGSGCPGGFSVAGSGCTGGFSVAGSGCTGGFSVAGSGCTGGFSLVASAEIKTKLDEALH